MSERRKYWKLNKLVKNVVYWVSVIPNKRKQKRLYREDNRRFR